METRQLPGERYIHMNIAMKNRYRAFVILTVFCLLAPLAPAIAQLRSAQSRDVVILAAASLKNALDEASAAWSKETGKATKISYAASPALAKQIEAGIPADLFISADIPWVDYVAERKLIKPASRFDFLGNEIVLIAPSSGSFDVTLQVAKRSVGEIVVGD